jgi:hypothetical protein
MKEVLLLIMCALCILVAGLLLYVGWLLYVMHKATRNRLRPPEVARDSEGRPLKERV